MRLKTIFVTVMFIASFIPFIAEAALLSCGKHKIETISVQGNRDDNHSHANSFMLTLTDMQCNNSPFLIMKNDHPAYQSMLSIAMAAKLSGAEVEVIVNTSKIVGVSATEISIIHMQ